MDNVCLHTYEYQYSFRVENSDPIYRYKCKECGKKINTQNQLNRERKEEAHDIPDHE